MPSIGDKVFIRPALPNVLADAVTGRFLHAEGEIAIWTAHHAERLKHGEIVVEGPAVEPRVIRPGEMLSAAPLPPGATAKEVE